MNECSFPNILLPAAPPGIRNKHMGVRRPSHSRVMLRTPSGTQKSAYFPVPEAFFDEEVSLGEDSVFAASGLPFGDGEDAEPFPLEEPEPPDFRP